MLKHIRALPIAAVAVAATFLAGCSTSSSHPKKDVQVDAKWAQSFTNIHDLTAHSDIAVAGSFAKVTNHTYISNVPSTDFSFTVMRILSDKKHLTSVGSAITIDQTGGDTPDGYHAEVGDDPLFTVGENAVLFLHQVSPGKFQVIGGPNGRFKVNGAANAASLASTTVTDRKSVV